MAEEKFTPGPWRIGPDYLDDEGYREIAIQAPTLNGECTPASVCLQFPTVPGMQDANAHLIAAAPELYVALRNILAEAEQVARSYCSSADWRKQWRREEPDHYALLAYGFDVLAKARGE